MDNITGPLAGILVTNLPDILKLIRYSCSIIQTMVGKFKKKEVKRETSNIIEKNTDIYIGSGSSKNSVIGKLGCTDFGEHNTFIGCNFYFPKE